MKALRFHAARDLRLEEIDDPAEPGPDQVVIRNRFCGICGTDLHEYTYGPIFIPKEIQNVSGGGVPQVLGHEFGGVVTKVGRGIRHVKPGDRVAVMPHIMPRSGDYYADRAMFQLSENLSIAGLSWIGGGMAEAALLNGYNVEKMPDDLSDQDAALVEPTAVAVRAVDRSGLRAGDSVLITGAGPIGLLTLFAARAAGAAQLFISDVNDTRLAIARRLMPEAITLNPGSDDVAARIRAATEGGVGCDVAIECVGNGAALNACVDAVRKRGVVVQLGIHPGAAAVDWFTVTFKDMEIRGSWCYDTFDWPRVMRLIASGRIPAGQVVTRTVPLSRAVAEGFDALLDPAGSHLKILIDLTA